MLLECTGRHRIRGVLKMLGCGVQTLKTSDPWMSAGCNKNVLLVFWLVMQLVASLIIWDACLTCCKLPGHMRALRVPCRCGGPARAPEHEQCLHPLPLSGAL